MSGRTYDQFCAVALALDQIGERWTLMIVRELLAGPARFSDLAAGLPGLASNLLTKRLRDLEGKGLVRQDTMPPPANVKVYALTERGQALGPVVEALARWGTQFLDPAKFVAPVNLRGMCLGFRLAVPEAATEGLSARIGIRAGEEAMTLVIADGKIDTIYGRIEDAEVTLDMPVEALFGLLGGVLGPRDAVQSGVATMDGSKQALNVFQRTMQRAVSMRAAAPS